MSRRTKDVVASKVHDIGEFISNKVFLSLPFTPTQLNLASFFSIVIAAFLFSFGQFKFNFLALFFIAIGTQFDYADGVVARARKQTNRFGGWFDPFLDLIGQHLIFIGMCFGVLRNYEFNPFITFLCFFGFWSIALNNFIGKEFNRTFGFDSYVGHQDFNDKFHAFRKISFFDSFLFNTVAPSSFIYFVLFTVRYFLLLGIVLNNMLLTVVLITFFGLLRAFLMIWAFVLYLREDTKHRVSKVLLEIEKK
ncbi:hypothetical protein COX24_03390 [bacterium (Candidatus Gribaldobacteria) CG23_combo_of_CG06-09_8_20_14_all_37_87_8]|uniref:CDP-alcohol phosphatidyltransferase n=1 Tax=bacterium (Candidatus Gribaldobacteria) CG23_combo_of_CG06-09_8_20_14_all_37_87_8 TaxID=2014278 RepID=A0A2G9ZE98_9BACT|nr:MAG: hypothetical protein COX24_03390 [bacterium (Candidatus Gribaldobacteria) CG23_combo_of_CG06-09_8_20_14_all_37_87_8]